MSDTLTLTVDEIFKHTASAAQDGCLWAARQARLLAAAEQCPPSGPDALKLLAEILEEAADDAPSDFDSGDA